MLNGKGVMAMSDILLYLAISIPVITFVVLYAYYDGISEGRKQQEKEDAKLKAAQEEAMKSNQTITFVIPEPNPMEEALTIANRESFQIDMGAMEAYRLLEDTARRHLYDPTPTADYMDAEWNV